MTLQPLTDWCKHCAVFFDVQGRPIGKKRLDYSQPTFIFMKGGYNFKPLKSSFFKITNILSTTKYYFYHLGNPNPLCLSYVPVSIVMSAEDYGTLLETDILRKLNDLSKENLLSKLLTPRNIIIGLVIIAAIYWMATHGGKLW
jgi:hypothetical protein